MTAETAKKLTTANLKSVVIKPFLDHIYSRIEEATLTPTQVIQVLRRMTKFLGAKI